MRPGERRALRAAERSQIQIDPALRIHDRASSLFVLLAVAVFGLILLNGIVLGTGGLLTPIPTPTVVPSITPGPSPTAVPSATPAASATAAPSGSTAPLPTATPVATPAPTEAATAEPSPTPAPS